MNHIKKWQEKSKQIIAAISWTSQMSNKQHPAGEAVIEN